MNTSNNTNTITGLTQIQQLQLQIDNQINSLSLQSINSNNPSYNADLDLRATTSVLLPNPNESNPNQAATIQYVLDHQGGGGSSQPLNEINIAHPLTNNLDFSSSQYTVRSHDPIADNDVAIKSWVQDQISHYTPVAIEALGDASTRTAMSQSGRFTYFQGVMKESVMNGLTTEYQPMRYDQDYQIIDPNQLVTYAQTTLEIEEEKNERIAADTQLQQNIDDLRNTPLNQWPTPMTPGILMNNFEMNGNNISGLAIQPQNGTPDNYAARVSFVNEAVNNLGFTLGGQISNVKVQCESYTDISVNNLSEQTQIDLATKQNIVPLNELPLPIAYLDLNGHRITNLAIPAVVDGDLDAVPKGYADSRYQLKTTPLNEIPTAVNTLNLGQNKISGLLQGTQSGDAINWDQLQDYITIQNASDAFRSRISTLSDIQAEEPANLNMNGYQINNLPNPTLDQQPVTLSYFNTHTGPSGNPNEIHNTTGNTSVVVNDSNQTIFTNNDDQIMRLEPSYIVTNFPVFSTCQPAFDPSNQLLTKQQNDAYYMSSTTRLNEIPYPEGNVTMNGYQLRDLPIPLEPHMAANKQYVDSLIGDSVNHIQNSAGTAIVTTNTDETVSIKASNGSTSLVVSSTNGSSYKIANGGNLEIQSNGIMTLNSGNSIQATAPIISNSSQSQPFQVLNRNQNDSRYLLQTTPLNDIVAPNADVNMNGFTLNNVSDAVSDLQVTNLAQVNSLIAAGGFKNKIASQNNHAEVICNPDDSIDIKANNAASEIHITSNGANDYTIANSGVLNINTNDLNVNNNAFRVLGNSGLGTVLLAADLRSSASDLGFDDQILTRAQNDARYLNSSTTNLSNIAPPTQFVNFSGQLLKNLQTPIQQYDAANKTYIDTELLNYQTIAATQANYLTKTDAANTYSTPSSTSNQITNALIPYSTTNQMNSAISTALTPYLTSSTASSTYQRQDTPFTSIQSTDTLNKITCNQGLNGIDVFASNAGVSNKICTISQPSSYPQSCQIVSPSRIFLTSGNGSMSFYSGTGQKNNSIYIGSSADSITENNYDQIVLGNGRSTCPQLTFSTGHSSSNIPYSIICNTNTTALNNLQLSPEISANVLTGNALNMYSSALISTFPILNQFTQPTGRSATQSSAQTNEFITKGYADAHYTGGGIQSLIQDSTTANKVACSSSNVQIYTPLISGSPSLIFKQSSSFPTYLEMNPSNVTGGLYISYPNIILQVAPTCFTDQTTASNTQLIQKQYADNQYAKLNGALNQLSAPTTAFNFNSQQITSLASGGVISGSNTNAINASDLFNYVTNANATQQTWTITLNGSSSTGIQWGNIPNNLSTTYAQTQKVKGSAGNLITSATIGCVSTTLASSWAIFDLQCASNIRITQVWAYSTTSAGTGSQQNIASLTYSQQASSTSGHTNLQLYKPATTQGSDTFILYFVVDSY